MVLLKRTWTIVTVLFVSTVAHSQESESRFQRIREETLLSTSQLHDLIQRGDPSIRILDGSLTESGYKASESFLSKHIPGARFFDLTECANKNSPFPLMLPSPEEFAEYVGHLGISNNHHVVVYDNSPLKIRSSPRVWWMFKVFGHDRVSVLNGGLPKWEEDGFMTTSEATSIDAQNFTASLYRPLLATFEDLIDNLRTGNYQVVDSRPNQSFMGLIPTSPVQPGHIPHSINIPFDHVLNPENLIKSTPELMDMLKKAGIDLRKPIISTCRSGILACITTLVAHLCGIEAPMYDGSWSEYYCRATTPDQVSLGPGYTYEDTC